MPVLALLGAAFFWGMIGPITKFTFLQGISPVEAAFWRSISAGVFFGIHSLVRQTFKIERKDWPALILFSVFGIASLESTFLISVKYIGGALASILLYSAPAWVTLFAKLFLGEKLTRKRVLALVMILVGVTGACLSIPGNISVNAVGIFFGLLSGISYAYFYLFGKKYFSKYEAPSLFFYGFILGGIAMVPAITFHEKTFQSWCILISLGLFSTYLAYLLYSIGLKKMDATRAALIASLEPVVSIVLSHFIWNEALTITTLAFSSLVILGSLGMAIE